MAKPRIFLSSTCYDLSEVRDRLRAHLEQLGMEAISSDTSSFGVTPGVHSHHACLDEVDRADYLVLIIGGRRGGTFVASQKSITNEEYDRACKLRIPIFTFVKDDVWNARPIFKQNPTANLSSVVDDVRVFDFVDLVHSASESNWIWPFKNGAEICSILTVQFAHIVKLFSERLVAAKLPSKKKQDSRLAVAFPGRLTQLPPDYLDDVKIAAWITGGLKKLHAVLSAIATSTAAGKDEKLKTLWLLGRYGQNEERSISIDSDQFKQFAWGPSKGQRILNQLKTFGVSGNYDTRPQGLNEPDLGILQLYFDANKNGDVVAALKLFVETLVERYGENGIELFFRADMNVFA